MKSKKNGHSPGEMSDSKESAHYGKPLDAKTPSLSVEEMVNEIMNYLERNFHLYINWFCKEARMSERQRILDILKKNECKIGTYHHMRIVKEIEQGGKDG